VNCLYEKRLCTLFAIDSDHLNRYATKPSEESFSRDEIMIKVARLTLTPSSYINFYLMDIRLLRLDKTSTIVIVLFIM